MGFWAVRELGYADGSREKGMGFGGAGSEGSAMTARILGEIATKRRRLLMSMDQGFGEESIADERKERRKSLERTECKYVDL